MLLVKYLKKNSLLKEKKTTLSLTSELKQNIYEDFTLSFKGLKGTQLVSTNSFC